MGTQLVRDPEHERAEGGDSPAEPPTDLMIGDGVQQLVEMVRRAQGGDRNAFGILYRQHARGVLAVVAERIQGADDRADAVQAVFLRAFERLKDLRQPERFASWLWAISRNVAADFYRRRRELVTVDGDLPEQEDSEPLPDVVAEVGALWARAQGEIALLSRRDATAITLSASFGFGTHELAAALGVSEGNAKVILHRARTRLRRQLELTGAG